jgi:hypothetical protein
MKLIGYLDKYVYEKKEDSFDAEDCSVRGWKGPNIQMLMLMVAIS